MDEIKVTYGIATPADYDEIIDHANFVFSYAHQPHEFKTLLPKAYGEERTMWPEHFLARENGRIRGLVGLECFDMRVLDDTIKLGFIGTVSVHHYSRGMGHMKKCMAMSTAYAKEQGLDIMVLGGQRQRYEYYGYEPGGTAFFYNVTPTNMRHLFAGLDVSDISFVPFAEMRDRMAELHAIYESGPVGGARPLHNFEQICGSWRCLSYAILRGDALLGYLICGGDHRGVNELRLTDVNDLTAVVKAYISRFELSSVTFRMPPHMPEYCRILAHICENMHTAQNEMFMILNYEHIVATYLKLKQHIEGRLPDGSVTLGITGIDGDAPKSLTISVDGGVIDCRYTDRQPDMVLGAIEAQSLLLSPMTFVDMTKLPACAKAYFPLPIHIESADGF